jgi:hypothetical protein
MKILLLLLLAFVIAFVLTCWMCGTRETIEWIKRFPKE